MSKPYRYCFWRKDPPILVLFQDFCWSFTRYQGFDPRKVNCGVSVCDVRQKVYRQNNDYRSSTLCLDCAWNVIKRSSGGRFAVLKTFRWTSRLHHEPGVACRPIGKKSERISQLCIRRCEGESLLLVSLHGLSQTRGFCSFCFFTYCRDAYIET